MMNGRRLVGLCVLLFAPSAPAALPYPPEPINGSLVIAGGEKLPESVRAEFFKLAGGKDKARLVLIAANHPDKNDDLMKSWKELTPADVRIARSGELAKPIADATGVWFVGDAPAILKTYQGTAVEKELLSLLKRGGVIGGPAVFSDLLIDGKPGFGFLPGIIFGKPTDRLPQVLEKHPEYAGLAIDEGTALVVTGRRIKVIGDRPASVIWSKSAIKEAREDTMKPGGELDLTQIRRAARFRTLTPPFPLKDPPSPVVSKGSLVIVGGGGTTPEIMNKFFELAGGKDALVVVIPTANEQDKFSDDAGDAKYLRKWGGTNVKVLHTRDRKQADDPEFSKILTEAKGVWFGGGRQWRFVDSYEGTLTEKRFREVLERGGVIGGSSAGASIQSEYMPRGHPLGNLVMAAEGYERGFGYLPGCAVDQHFFARKRTADMTGLMKMYPQLLGIGLDEATAIIMSGHTAEVVGKSKAAFYDYRNGPPKGEKDYVEVSAGGKYDLKERKPLK